MSASRMLLAAPQLFLTQLFNKVHEAGGLSLKALGNFIVGEFARGIEQLADAGHEDTARKNECIPITEDGLQLFDRPERTPDSRGQPDETNWPMFEAFRKGQHVDEVFQHTWDTAVVFRSNDDDAIRCENLIGESGKAGGLLCVGTGRKNFRRHFRQVEQLCFHAERFVNRLNVGGDFACVASGPVGSTDDDNHGNTLFGSSITVEMFFAAQHEC